MIYDQAGVPADSDPPTFRTGSEYDAPQTLMNSEGLKPARQLLDEAAAVAESSAAAIGVTARFHIARVLTAWSKEEARAVLLRAIRELPKLALGRHDMDALTREAHMLTAATAPDLEVHLAPLSGRMSRHSDFQLYRTLLDHGHIGAAVERLISYEPAVSFPHGVIGMVLAGCSDGETKLAILRRATQSWQESLSVPSVASARLGPRPAALSRSEFLRVFVYHWRILPAEEALPIVRKLLATILEAEDSPMQGSFDPERRVTFNSTRQYNLFELLDPLRHLEAALADLTISDNPELAAAAAIFPLGMHSVHEAWAKRSNRQCNAGGGYILGGSDRDIQFDRALLDGRALGNFDPAFDQVLKTFQEDVESNAAVKECWPSTQSFRTLLYEIGKTVGLAGATYLSRIPDPDLLLYSQIELAAALACLPSYSGMRTSSPRLAHRAP